MSQPNLLDYIEARNAAIEQVSTNAGESFMNRARAFVLDKLQAGPASGEDLTDACKEAGIVPVNGDKAFGGVMSSLSRRGLIEKAGFCERKKGHATAGGLIWKLR